MEQKAPRNVSWCYALNSYAERFNVEKVSDEVRVNWKGSCHDDTSVLRVDRAAEIVCSLRDGQVNCLELTGLV